MKSTGDQKKSKKNMVRHKLIRQQKIKVSIILSVGGGVGEGNVYEAGRIHQPGQP